MQKKLSKRSILSSIILFFIWFATVIFNITSSSRKLYLCLWILVLCGGLLFSNFKINKPNILESWWLIFIMYGFFTTVLNNLLGTIGTNSIVSYIINFIIPVISIFIFTKSSSTRVFIRIFQFFISFFSILGIYEFITSNQFYRGLIKSFAALSTFETYGVRYLSDYRTTLIFYHPFYYSMFLVIFLLTLIYFPYSNKIAETLFFILGSINLVLTQTRSNWLSFIFILILFFMKRREKVNKNFIRNGIIFLSIIVIAFLLFNYIPFLKEIIFSRFSEVNQNASDASGARLGQLTLIENMNTLFLKLFGGGEGYGISILKQHPIRGWIVSIDNQYLSAYLDFGIIGLSLFLVCVSICVYKFFKTKDKENEFLLLALSGIFFSSLFFSVYKASELCYFMFILIGLVKFKKMRFKDQKQEERV